MRRGAPVAIIAVVLALLIGSYVAYTRTVVLRLRQDAGRLGLMHARVFHALADTSNSADVANAALLDLARHITALGVPVVITDMDGRPTYFANLPFGNPSASDPRVKAYVSVLDQQNDPVSEPGVGQVHFGDSRLVQSLRFIPVIQVMLLLAVIGAGIYVMRTRSRADRESVWAGMARESAHQLGTPLSSLSGWIELLSERAESDAMVASAVGHMQADLERLDRVATRFERIGRPPRRDEVDIGELVQRVAAYFQARVPTLAHRVRIAARVINGPLYVRGDAVLLEWALEVLCKNAIDALSGRGGSLKLFAKRIDHDHVRVRVADDGPGVPRELRARIFEPGFSTKKSGWGIGLSLAKRIVEENHGGRLLLVPTEHGATFDVIIEG